MLVRYVPAMLLKNVAMGHALAVRVHNFGCELLAAALRAGEPRLGNDSGEDMMDNLKILGHEDSCRRWERHHLARRKFTVIT
jgi:hypothetical protein